jgi:hypothetical protein
VSDSRKAQLRQNEPSKRDGINDGAWKHHGDGYTPKS